MENLQKRCQLGWKFASERYEAAQRELEPADLLPDGRLLESLGNVFRLREGRKATWRVRVLSLLSGGAFNILLIKSKSNKDLRILMFYIFTKVYIVTLYKWSIPPPQTPAVWNNHIHVLNEQCFHDCICSHSKSWCQPRALANHHGTHFRWFEKHLYTAKMLCARAEISFLR